MTRLRCRAGRRGRRDDQGFVAVWTVAITSSVFVIIAFTLDAGRVVRANSDAYGTAAAAARIGVQQIDERIAVAEGRVALLPDEAIAAAEQYVADEGYDGTATVDGLEVTVTVRGSVDPHLPGLNVQQIETTASALAIQVSP